MGFLTMLDGRSGPVNNARQIIGWTQTGAHTTPVDPTWGQYDVFKGWTIDTGIVPATATHLMVSVKLKAWTKSGNGTAVVWVSHDASTDAGRTNPPDAMDHILWCEMIGELMRIEGERRIIVNRSIVVPIIEVDIGAGLEDRIQFRLGSQTTGADTVVEFACTLDEALVYD